MAELAPPELLAVTTTHNGPLGRIAHMEYHEVRQPEAAEPGDPYVLVAIEQNEQTTVIEAIGMWCHPDGADGQADRSKMNRITPPRSYKAEVRPPEASQERRLILARGMAAALFAFDS